MKQQQSKPMAVRNHDAKQQAEGNANNTAATNTSNTSTIKQPEPPPAAGQSKGPMTQKQYLELQSQIREVTDPQTGRTRLVRGTGEIIERIVSRSEHSMLNARATLGDGSGYAKDIMRAAMKK